jgi:hypothetical protein
MDINKTACNFSQNHIVWKNLKPNDGFGFCPNVAFEDGEFKEANKAVNDQGEGAGTNYLFSSLNSSGSVLTFSTSQALDLST